MLDWIGVRIGKKSNKPHNFFSLKPAQKHIMYEEESGNIYQKYVFSLWSSDFSPETIYYTTCYLSRKDHRYKFIDLWHNLKI